MLPYTSWLDYCRIGYVVSEHVAKGNMARVLRSLERVSAHEAEAKHEQLKRVVSAFVFRTNSSAWLPSAAEFILGEACSAARRLVALGSQADARATIDHKASAALDDSLLQRCGF